MFTDCKPSRFQTKPHRNTVKFNFKHFTSSEIQFTPDFMCALEFKWQNNNVSTKVNPVLHNERVLLFLQRLGAGRWPFEVFSSLEVLQKFGHRDVGKRWVTLTQQRIKHVNRRFKAVAQLKYYGYLNSAWLYNFLIESLFHQVLKCTSFLSIFNPPAAFRSKWVWRLQF